MNVEIIQNLNKDYFLEYYSQWLKYRSKFRKYQKIIAFVFIFLGLCSGIYFYFLYNLFSYSFFVGVFLGLLLYFDFYYTKRKLLQNQIQGKQNNFAVKICFDDNKISNVSEFGTSSLNWNFFTDAIKTKKGLFLLLRNNTSIYI